MMYDKESQKVIDNAPKDAIKRLELGYTLREEAKCQEEDAAAIKESADIILGEVFKELGVDKVKHEKFGTLSSVKDRTRVTYSGKKILEYLVSHGVSKAIAKNAVEAGKSESTYSFIEYRRPTKKKEK